MSDRVVIDLRNVWVYYDNVPVLEGINLSVEQGDFLGIIGPNGGGKTTLLKIILGLITPAKGTVSVMGKSPQHSRYNIGYVPQYNFFDHNFPINVWQVVLIGRFSKTGILRRYTDKDKTMARAALQTVGMVDYADQQIGKLSGGEQQRVFIARALASEPKLLLLDEPTTNIDTHIQTEFYELLEKLKKEMAIIMVSHDISAISVYVDKIACLNHQLFYHGSKEIDAEILEATYKCPVQMIAHGTVPHRILREH